MGRKAKPIEDHLSPISAWVKNKDIELVGKKELQEIVQKCAEKEVKKAMKTK